MFDFARLVSFEGRSGRSVFWWAIVATTLVVLAPITTGGLLMLLNLPGWSPTAVLDGPEAGWAMWQQLTSLAYLVLFLPTLWLLLAALVRRCHDRNWSGAFLLVGLIPVVQIWPLIELGLMKGSPGQNGFGPAPGQSLDVVQPMHFEPVRADSPLEPFPTATSAAAAVRDPFTLPAAEPLAAYRFDDPPLTLSDAPEPAMRATAPHAPRQTPLILAPLVKYARFDGRATRSEFWLFALVQWALLIGVIGGLMVVLPPGQNSIPFMVMGVATLFIALFVPNLAVTSRRLHDSGLSFAWWLVILVPVIGGLIGLVLLCLGGTRGENAYGANPRGA